MYFKPVKGACMERNQVIIIPVYKPSLELIDFIEEIHKSGFKKIIVVNDGSGSEYKKVFENVVKKGCCLVEHEVNAGKGTALKTGFKLALKLYGETVSCITADSDGQHRVYDIVKVAEAMCANPNTLILGSRDFKTKNVPIKSLVGNKISAIIFRLSTGIKCNDTQTGLRGIPQNILRFALEVEGSRYEYEYNFLQEASAKFPIISVPIATVYINNNSSSHFRCVRDALRIYSRLIKFVASSVVGSVVDISLFYLFTVVLPLGTFASISIATVLARIISGAVNFILNRKMVFASSDKTLQQSLKYTALFFAIMAASAVGTATLSSLLQSSIISKIIIDGGLFLFSYKMQKNWVFKNNISKQTASRVWKISATAFFVFYVGFSLLNRFIIPQNVVALEINSTASQEQITPEDNSSQSMPSSESAEQENVPVDPVVTQNSYESDTVDITISTIREYDTDIYIAEVKIEDSDLLQSGLAYGSFGNNLKQTTSEIAQANDAILAINGDFYGFRDTGYVMRNGQLYRDVAMSDGNDDLVIYNDGSMDVINESNITATELANQGAEQIYSFGPGLISDGEILVDENSQVDREDPSNPRTAIGMIAPNHYIFLVADGRTTQSEGLSLVEIATVLSSYGCVEGYNLDGGGSATMVFMGEVVNNPTTNGKSFKERSVSDIVYIAQ